MLYNSRRFDIYGFPHTLSQICLRNSFEGWFYKINRIGADTIGQLLASSMLSEKLQPRAVEHTYLNKAVEQANSVMMTELADVRMGREMSIAMARQVSRTFKIALVKQGCLLGSRLERLKEKVLKITLNWYSEIE